MNTVTRAKFAVPLTRNRVDRDGVDRDGVDRDPVARDWPARGYSCGLFSDPPEF